MMIRTAKMRRRRSFVVSTRTVVFDLLLLVVLVSLSFSIIPAAAAAAAASSRNNRSSSFDPYSVLGVTPSSSQDDVRRSYRKLCLELHPDKNVDKGEAERSRREEAFKSVQRANELIGDEDGRRRYDRSVLLGAERGHSSQFGGNASGGYGGRGSASGHPYGGISPEDLFREFYGGRGSGMRGPRGFYYRRTRRAPFYFNGIDISDLFPGVGGRGGNWFGGGGLANPEDASSSNYPRSIFVQRVTIPLAELYTGVESKVFSLKDSVWQRYRAAFRGGIAGPLALQAFLMSGTLLLRTSWPVSLAAFLASFHLSLPRPTRLFYRTEVGRGWKGGTRVTFEGAEPGVDVVFIIDEGADERFKRVNGTDDLETTATVDAITAERGGSILIKPLGKDELPVLVKVRPGEIERDGQAVTVRGRGWPRRGRRAPGEAERGDLRVVFRIVAADEEKKKRGRRRTSRGAEADERRERRRSGGKKAKKRR